MKQSQSNIHVYDRTITFDGQDSLSVLARYISPGQTLLDLGMGTGALGRFLQSSRPCILDGVTLSEKEAEIAATVYRNTWVADLDDVNLLELTTDTYDCIICADILEHLKHPERILTQCRLLLRRGGFLLTSVPNAGYAGLVAELLQGDFRYRKEGLLDQTHLRFFTRRSLMRFFAEQHWQVIEMHAINKPIHESEFKIAIDTLPPSVSRYLLSVSDALSYQFVQKLVPSKVANNKNNYLDNSEAQVLFTAQLYYTNKGIFEEHRKSIARGVIGKINELIFDVPASPNSIYDALRLDPADRPGFMRLSSIELFDTKNLLLWRWQDFNNISEKIDRNKIFHISWSNKLEKSNEIWMTLLGDDPWFILPLTNEVLSKLSASGGRVHVKIDWPMSADYLQAAENYKFITQQQEKERLEWMLELERLKKELELARLDNQSFRAQINKLENRLKDIYNKKEEKINDLKSKINLLEYRTNIYRNRDKSLLNEVQLLRVQLEKAGEYVKGIEGSRLYRWTRPLSHINYLLRYKQFTAEVLSPSQLPQPVLHASEGTNQNISVDVIIPVYRGLEDTRRCIESVLESNVHTNWHLIVINDCSPEPELTKWLQDKAISEPRMKLLENKENLGFVKTVNKGMQLHLERDVLLLNSDTEVANDWLDRLQRAAYSDSKVGTVTPFSNNATICSYPRFCQSNAMPEGWTTAELDQLCSRYLSGRYVEVPTAVGFCMYIRRQCINKVGYFDEVHFGTGYGEENDFCIRSNYAGWRHLHTLDTFVRHAGGVSFGSAKPEKELLAVEILDRLHPGYKISIRDFVAKDPTRNARLVIDLARLVKHSRALILMVSHNREGGTMRHIQELARYLAPHAICLTLRPQYGGVLLSLEGPDEDFKIPYLLPADQDLLIQHLRLLQVSHIHFHHLLGQPQIVMELPSLLGVTHDFTAHDFYSYCPQISLSDNNDRYCGEYGLDACARCLIQSPAPDGVTIEDWRQRHEPLLNFARNVFAPSHDTARRMKQFVPLANIVVVPHSHLSSAVATTSIKLRERKVLEDNPLRIVVVGALSRIKGADILEGTSILAARLRQPLEFHLLGYGYRSLQPPPISSLTVHGAYKDEDLPQLLEAVQPDVVWFPAQWPETYSYTLSACLESGLPVVVPDLGAFSERVAGRQWSWVMPWTHDAQHWLDFFCSIRLLNFIPGVAPPPAPKRTLMNADKESDYSDYLSGISFDRGMSIDSLIELQYGMSSQRDKSSNTVNGLIRKKTLIALEWLRRHPLFAGLVSHIPSAAQRRVKTWLLS